MISNKLNNFMILASNSEVRVKEEKWNKFPGFDAEIKSLFSADHAKDSAFDVLHVDHNPLVYVFTDITKKNKIK